MKVTPYLFFAGDCVAALEFYRQAIGADVRALAHYRDMPGANAAIGDKVMHAEFSVGDSTIFASDGQARERAGGGYALALQAGDESEAEQLFGALAEGGKIDVPLMTTPFAARFGMLTDRHGTPWMVTTPQTAMK